MVLFSIIIPLYNKEEYIVKTVQSVLSQSYKYFELIIVNDGSTDTSLSLIQDIVDNRLRVISKPNGGVSSARNLGIKHATGKWITFFDADDIMYSNALDTYIRVMKQYPNYDIIVAATDQSKKKYNSTNKTYLVDDYSLYNAINYAKSGFSLINTDCICVRKILLDKVGYFNEQYTHGEDQDLWIRLSGVSKIVKIDKAIGLYVTDIPNNSTHTDFSNRRYAPIALLETERQNLKSRSEKIMQGSKVFFHVFMAGLKREPLYSIKLMIKYFDCVMLFLPFILKYRVLKKDIK